MQQVCQFFRIVEGHLIARRPPRMLVVTESGEAKYLEPADHRGPIDVKRAQGLVMLRLQRRKWSTREIAAFFGVSHTTVENRLADIPDEVKARAASLDLV